METEPILLSEIPSPFADETELTVEAHFGVEVLVRCPEGIHYRLGIQHGEKWLVGDVLEYSAGAYLLRPRRNVLQRRAAGERGIHLLAANIDRVLITTTAEPPPRVGLIDRLLMMLQQAGIDASLLVTKSDQPGVQEYAQGLNDIYGNDYTIAAISVLKPDGLKDFQALCPPGSRNILIGPSGVGKSSLLSYFFPDAQIAIGALSAATGRGKHTTTHTAAFWHDSGFALIDTPGIRDFGLVDIDEETLRRDFHEVRHLKPCRFRSCAHLREPGCSFRAAVESGAIHPNRHKVYHQLYAEVQRLDERSQSVKRARSPKGG